MPRPDTKPTTPTPNKLSLKQRFGIGIMAGITALTLTGCDNNTNTDPTLPAPSNISSTETGQTTTTNTPEATKNPEELKIAGDWNCTQYRSDGAYGPLEFSISEIDTEQFQMSREGAEKVTLPLEVNGNTISWYGDTGNNPKGWDVTLNLVSGGLNGASGSYINHFNETTNAIENCEPGRYQP